MVRGSCLCGGIRFEVDCVPVLHSCHCTKCRKAHGTAFRTAATVPADTFRFLAGEDLVTVWRDAPQGYAAAFCRVCGSNAPSVSEALGLAFVPAGLFDEDPGARPRFHVFVGSKAPWWEITDDATQYEEFPPGFSRDD